MFKSVTMIGSLGQSVRIQIEDGLKNKTICDIAEAGTDVLMTASFIFGTDGCPGTMAEFKKLLED